MVNACSSFVFDVGPDPDLIIRMPDGYHGAIAASLTDYAGTPEADPSSTEPPLLSLEGLWQMAQFIEQQRHLHPLPDGDEILYRYACIDTCKYGFAMYCDR